MRAQSHSAPLATFLAGTVQLHPPAMLNVLEDRQRASCDFGLWLRLDATCYDMPPAGTASDAALQNEAERPIVAATHDVVPSPIARGHLVVAAARELDLPARGHLV